MKRKIISGLLIVMLAFSACARTEDRETEQTPVTNEEDTKEKEITVYYVEPETEEIKNRKITVEGDLSKEIVSRLQEEKLLTEACDVQDVTFDEKKKTMELDINESFGNYLRGMGTTGSELVIECVARSYLTTYHCDELKITEEGKPLDTGHVVLDGYISYK